MKLKEEQVRFLIQEMKKVQRTILKSNFAFANWIALPESKIKKILLKSIPDKIGKEGRKSCPYCGHIPEIFPWHGGAPTKHMVSCENEKCPVQPSVTGETKQEAIENWNTRE